MAIQIGTDHKVDMLFKKLLNLKGHTVFGAVEKQPGIEFNPSVLQITSDQVWSSTDKILLDRNPLNPGNGALGTLLDDAFTPLAPDVFPFNIRIDDINGAIPTDPGFKRNSKDPTVTGSRLPIIHTTKADAYLSRSSISQTRPTYSVDGENIYERIVVPLEYVPFSGDTVAGGGGSWRYMWTDSAGTVVDELDLLVDGTDTANTTVGSRVIPYTFRSDLNLAATTNGANSLFGYIIGTNPSHTDAMNGKFTKFLGANSDVNAGNWFFDNDALQLNFFAADEPVSSSDTYLQDFFGGKVGGFSVVYNDTTAIAHEDIFDPPTGRILTPANSDALYVLCYRYIGPIGVGSGGGGSSVTIEDAVKCRLFYIDDATTDATGDLILGGNTTAADKINYLSGLTGSASEPYIILSDGVTVAGITDSNSLGLSQSEIYFYDDTVTSWVLDTPDNTFATNYLDETRFLLEPVSATISLPLSIGGATPSGFVSVGDKNSIIEYDGTLFAGEGYAGDPDSWVETVPTTGMRTTINCENNQVVEWSGTEWINIISQDIFYYNQNEDALETFIDYDFGSDGQIDFEPAAGVMTVQVNGVDVSVDNYLFGEISSSAVLTVFGQLGGSSVFTVPVDGDTPSQIDYLLLNATDKRGIISVTASGATATVTYAGPEVVTITSASKLVVTLRNQNEAMKDDYIFWKGSNMYQLDTDDCLSFTYHTADPGAV